ncbi:hypothetical protein [uncultured Halomonas sp.]|uniref:hypothetical protein n=1 Tax=uncultured Halomonas sp. TaxID=173971 RepID=UPI00261E37D2|nr:hypothetical protein [uncultured Halomonas sp.]
MQPLIVTAKLMTGFASKFDWSPSIDGILAWVAQRERLGVEEFIATHHRVDVQAPVEGLPLAVERFGDDWWYQASMPIFRSQGVMTHSLHKRFNAGEAERRMHSKQTKIQTTKGPYKNARYQLRQHITHEAHWHVVGYQGEIQRMLKQVTHVGAKVGAGYGRVRYWMVEPGGSEELARLFRPLPEAFAEQQGVTGMRLEWGHRPPIRLPENQRLCVIPDAG